MSYSYVLGYDDAPKGTIFRHRTIAGKELACVDEHGKQPGDYWIRVTAEFEIATLAELKARVKQDTGEVPEWLATCPPAEYIGVEHEYVIGGRWFTACIEGNDETEPCGDCGEPVYWDEEAVRWRHLHPAPPTCWMVHGTGATLDAKKEEDN